MPSPTRTRLREVLTPTFDQRHIEAALEHFELLTNEFQIGSWEECLVKAGKFVEAVLKALWAFVGNNVPPAKEFKVDVIIRGLENTAAPSAPTTVRVTIPRASRFVYEIASNRGARHDPDEINPNEMDALAAVSNCSWILAEMVRFAARGTVDPAEAHGLVSRLTERKLPLFEEVDGRLHFHIPGLGPRDVELLNLWHAFPERINSTQLVEAAIRRGATPNAARLSLYRLRLLVDDDGQGNLRLLAPGLAEAEQLLMAGAHRRNGAGRVRRRRN
ncbi:MAG: hypothetical protein ACLPXM_02505 [Terriglobales bacterium]